VNSKAKFEAPYLRNNAVNKKSPRGISGEMLFEQHILISWKNIKNPLATKLESDCLCFVYEFRDLHVLIGLEPLSQNVNKCAGWSRTKFTLVIISRFHIRRRTSRLHERIFLKSSFSWTNHQMWKHVGQNLRRTSRLNLFDYYLRNDLFVLTTCPFLTFSYYVSFLVAQ
jgi:hypothetical protein